MTTLEVSLRPIAPFNKYTQISLFLLADNLIPSELCPIENGYISCQNGYKWRGDFCTEI